MASITIRNIDDTLKKRLRLRAAQHGRSMEEEVREILRTVLLRRPAPERDLVESIRRRLAPYGSVDLPIPIRQPMREPPSFD